MFHDERLEAVPVGCGVACLHRQHHGALVSANRCHAKRLHLLFHCGGDLCLLSLDSLDFVVVLAGQFRNTVTHLTVNFGQLIQRHYVFFFHLLLL